MNVSSDSRVIEVSPIFLLQNTWLRLCSDVCLFCQVHPHGRSFFGNSFMLKVHLP